METLIGKIVGTYGLKGEVKVWSNTDFAKIRYQKGNEVICINKIKNTREILRVASYKSNKNLDIVSFENKQDINLVESYIGCELFIEKSEEKLAKGAYYYSELLNCKVYYQEKLIGVVVEIMNNGAHQTLRIQPEEGKDILYPFIEKFFEKIDVESKCIYLSPIEGLL